VILCRNAAWNMIRDIVGADPALSEAAWEELRGIVGMLPGGEGEAIPDSARTACYFEF
jgi:hypothetical protein